MPTGNFASSNEPTATRPEAPKNERAENIGWWIGLGLATFLILVGIVNKQMDAKDTTKVNQRVSEQSAKLDCIHRATVDARRYQIPVYSLTANC